MRRLVVGKKVLIFWRLPAVEHQVCSCGREYIHSGALPNIKPTEPSENDDIVRVEQLFWLTKLGGQIYVEACDCWHDKAHRIVDFLDKHALQLNCYFSLERTKKREG